MAEHVTTPVGVNDVYYLGSISRLQEQDIYVPEIKNLASVSADLASQIGELGLGEATHLAEPIAFLELDRKQKLVLDQARELREAGQVILRAFY